MKKVLSVLLAFALIFTLGVSAMALTSPGGETTNKVVINRTNTGESSTTPEVKMVVQGDDITISPVKNEEIKFNGWEIYTDAAKKKPAKEGTDYEVVSVNKADGSAAEEGKDYKVEDGKIIAIDNEFISITVKPLYKDLYVSEAYEGVEIKFPATSPVTGESANNGVVTAVVLLVMVISAAVAFGTKSALN